MQGGRTYGSGGLWESRQFPKGEEELSPSEDNPARTRQKLQRPRAQAAMSETSSDPRGTPLGKRAAADTNPPSFL